MRRCLFLLLLICIASVAVSSVGYANDVTDLDKLLQDIKLGQKFGQLNYIFLPEVRSDGVTSYEGQLGELKLKVMTKKENNEEIVIHFSSILKNNKNDAWLPTVVKYLEKPTKKP